MSEPPRKLCLFDVDNTITKPRQVVSPEMDALLSQLRATGRTQIGIVSASDIATLSSQLASSDQNKLLGKFDYVFADNGVTGYKSSELFFPTSFFDYVEPDVYKELISFILYYIGLLDVPKRDRFIELRTGVLVVTPVGRSATEEERKEFERLDNIHHIRKKFIMALRKKFKSGEPEVEKPVGEKWKFIPDATVRLDDGKELTFTTAGTISINIIPKGWDKSYCLQFIEEEEFGEIHFFGDKTQLGGNDYEIYEDERIIGHQVANPDNTMEILKAMFHLT